MAALAKQTLAPRPKPANNIYTALLALSLLAVLASAAFIAVKCYIQYGTFFTIP